jgi:hypothetical protein
MLDPADILLDRQPRDCRGIERPVVRAGWQSAGNTTTNPRRYRAYRSRAAPALPHCGQSTCFQVGCRSSGLPGTELDILGQLHRQMILARHGHNAADLAVDEGDRRAPVALARNAPVAQAILLVRPRPMAVDHRPGEVRGDLPWRRRRSCRQGSRELTMVPSPDIGLGRHRKNRFRIRVGARHHAGSPAGHICGRNRGRAGHVPGSRRSRRCHNPSARNWRHRPAGASRAIGCFARATRYRSPSFPPFDAGGRGAALACIPR